MRNTIIAIVVALAIGFGIGKYVGGGNIQQETTKEKEVAIEDTIIVKEEKRPDGTVVKEVTTTKKKETTTKGTSIKIVENKPDWKASALVGYNLDKSAMVYGASVDRRILGNIFVGAWGTTDKQVGLSVGMEF